MKANERAKQAYRRAKAKPSPTPAKAPPPPTKATPGKGDVAAGEAPRPKWTIVRERFDEIKPEYLTWLWDGVWLDASLNLLTGSPGLGKTFVAAHLAASVSRGLPWPDGRGTAPLGDVIFMSAEDSYASVLVHRVKAAGGDLTRIHRWVKKTIVLPNGKTDEEDITLEDIEAVTADIEHLPNLKLVIFDPVTSYLGSADANDNAEVRRVLGKIVALAEAKGFMVLLITHDKKMNVAAINSPMGSTAFTALPRVVQGLFRDPEDETKKKRLLLPIKNNHGDDRQGRAFTIDTPGGKGVLSYIRWEEQPETRTADEVKAQTIKALSFVGKDHGEEETQKRRHGKILQIIDAEAGKNDGWISLADIRVRAGMSNQTLGASIYEMVQASILEEVHVDKALPNGAFEKNGQTMVRRKRHVL